MSETFNNKSLKEKFIIIIVFPVILALVFFLLVSLVKIFKPVKYTGELFGKKISQSEFESVYNHNRLQSMIRYGQMFEKLEPLLDLDEETWDQLIILKAAEQRKIRVSDKEVVNAIADYPIFFRKSKFDSILYKDIIRNSLQAEPEDFEESVRESLIAEKLYDDVTQDVTINEEDLFAEYQKRKDKVQYEYFTVSINDYINGVYSSEDEQREYFNQHKDDFEISDTVQVEYVKLPFPEEGGIQKEVETKFKAKAIIDKYKEGKSLKEAAAALKFESQKTKFFTKSNPPDETGIDWSFKLLMETFRMRLNDISEPIELEDGYAVIKMNDKKPPYIPEFEEAKDDVYMALHKEKARAQTEQKAAEHAMVFLNGLNLSKDTFSFKMIATGLGLSAKDTGFVERKAALTTIGALEESEEHVMALRTPGTLSRVIKTKDGSAILYLKQFTPVSGTDYNKDRVKFRDQILSEKKDEVYNAFLENIKKEAHLLKYN